MRIVYAILVILLLLPPAAIAQVEEEIETYLVAPHTQNKWVIVVTSEGKKIEGQVTSGDDEKITVQPKTGGPVEVRTDKIITVRFRRPKRSTGIDFAGNMIGGVGFGIGGAQLGKHAGESIRGDGSPGRIGPIVGGVVLGFAGGYVGREIARRSASEEVTFKVIQGVEGQPPKVGAITLPVPPPDARVQPVDLRR